MKSLSPSRSVRFLLLACIVALLVACGARTPGPATPKTDGPLVVGTGKTESPGVALAASPAREDDAAVPIAPDDAVRGSRLAYVTIVLFSDFQCPFCGRLDTTFDRLREEYGDDKLRFVFKHNPLPFHEHARLAAEVAQGVLALAGQEAFWRYQSMAFRRQSAISPETIRTWATSAGADPRALEQGIQAKRWAAKVDADVELAKRLNASGTPASFVNGVALSGAQPFDKFKTLIDAELEKAQSLVSRGVERSAIYTRLAAANFKTDSDDEDADPAAAAAAAAAELAASKLVHKIPVGAAPVRGPATALVTIIVFSEFQCPYCKRGEETLARIRREYGDKVRVVWRDMPLPFHPRAEPAAELARFARAQKGDAGFWAVHDLLFASQPKLEDTDLARIAGEAKLDVAKAMTAVSVHAYKSAIEADMSVGDDFQASGTPHHFVNGRRLVGAQSFDKFKVIIDEEIAASEALLRAGTSRAALYETRIKDGVSAHEPEKKTIAAPPAPAPFRGAVNGKVVIHEVSDFQCPFCQRAEATMEEILKAYPGKVKIVWRDKPLPMHADAPLAAEAAREAFAQKGNEGFAKMQKLLFENQKSLKRQDLDGYARTIGLDMARFATALDTHAHKAVIDADASLAGDAGVTGTPAFFVGPYYLSGAQAFSKFRKVIELTLNPPAPVAVAPAVLGKGLVITEIAAGSGRAVKTGDRVKVHYVGTLLDGTEFDSSRKHGQPFAFEVGKGVVIKGWDQGLVGMKINGKRKLTIPPDLAYGARGVPRTIPPGATLVFEVELVAID